MFALCLLVDKAVTLLAILKAFPSNSGKYRVGKYSTDCVSAMLPLVVVTHRVAMDTSFRHDANFSTPPTS